MPDILDFMREVVARTPGMVVGEVLEVGSADVNGTPRTVFQSLATGYTGVDIVPARCVDLLVDGERLADNFPADHFDTIVCCETLEHCPRPWAVVAQMRDLLKPGGRLWVSTPTFGFPEHRFPLDCYRFGEDAYRHWIYAGYAPLTIVRVGTPTHPGLAAVGQKPG